MSTLPEGHPERWAASKLAEARRRWGLPAFATTARAAVARLMPGSPVSWVFGFAANGGTGENTTGWVTGSPDERAAAERAGRRPLGGVAAQSFHELGAFGVEGGAASGPAPGAGSAWSTLAVSEDVRAVLGRAASTSPGGWRNVSDQVAVGVANLRRHARGVWALLPPEVRWPVDANRYPVTWTPWVASCASCGWSAGDAGMGRLVTQELDAAGRAALAAVPEADRWEALCALVLARLEANPMRPLGARSHGANPAYRLVRTLQKLKAGELLSREVEPSGAGWYAQRWPSGVDGSAVVERLTVLAYRGRAAGGSVPSPGTGGSGPTAPRSGATVAGELLGGATVAALVGALFWWWRS